MSCYEWERGSWVLSCAEYPKLRRGVIEAHNRRQEARYQRALALHKRVIEENKGKHGVKWDSAIADTMMVRTSYGVQDYSGVDQGIVQSMMVDKVELTEAELRERYRWCSNPDDWQKHVGETKHVRREKPRQPRKNDFPLASRNTDSFMVDDGGGRIVFKDEERRVLWQVEENNHACESARSDPLASDFFRLLNQVNWTRGTGGEIVGNDEYNKDSDSLGGGGNYSKGKWPKTPSPVCHPVPVGGVGPGWKRW